jgi:hypothetical protein
MPQLDLIISHAARLRIPAVYAFTDMVKAGGLVSDGPDNPDLLRRAAAYVTSEARRLPPVLMFATRSSSTSRAKNGNKCIYRL